MDEVILNIHQRNKHVDAPNISMEPTTGQADADICLAAVRDKLSMLSLGALNSSSSVCIYKVPENFRNRNGIAYTPRLVSIGFIHHGDDKVQPMEEYKFKYLQNFLHVFQVSLEDLVEYVDGQQKLVCGCYEDAFIRSLPEGKVPSEVILLDGVFVVQLFMKNYFVELRENGDILFGNIWVYNTILYDMLLMENQLPFTFLNSLYDKFVLHKVGKWLDTCVVRPPRFIELSHNYFKDVGNIGKLLLEGNSWPPRHFVEFLHTLHKPDGNPEMERSIKGWGLNFAVCPTATELKVAGVKFRKGTQNRVYFDHKIGELEIPPLTVVESTETFYYNLLAFEQSSYSMKHVSSYIILLGNLLKTHRDVDILIESSIIKNEFGSTEKVANLFSNLYKDLAVNEDEFLYVSIFYQLRGYIRNPWYWWNAKVFKLTPMVYSIGVLALLGVALSIVQTVCSILQVVSA